MSRIRTQLIIVCGIGLFLTSCQGSLAMWVAPGSTVNNLVFGWSTARDSDEKVRPEQISVYPCDTISRQSDGSYYPSSDRAVWQASSGLDSAPPTNRITFGQGFSHGTSKPLTAPGCYVVISYAYNNYNNLEVATMGFNIAVDGTVTDMPRDEYVKLFR